MAKNKMPKPPGAIPEDQDIDDMEMSPELEAASEEMPVEIPKVVSKKKLKVRATRAGFIHNERKVENDKFECHQHELGSWMECEDPMEQKRHLQRLLDKKKKANLKGIKEQEEELADE